MIPSPDGATQKTAIQKTKPVHTIAIQHARIIAKKAGKAIGKAARSPFSSAKRHPKPALAHKQKKEAKRAAEQFHPPRSYGQLQQGSTFFRDKEQIASFTKFLNQRSDKRTSIWSVGCATGEEPYSLAILATELFGKDGAHARVSITATDIDYRVLGFSAMAPKKKKHEPHPSPALRGTYPAKRVVTEFALFFDNAGNDGSESRIRRYFIYPAGSDFVLKSTLRSLVRFQQADIVESAPVDRKTGEKMKFDMVFCNNVLRYFDDSRTSYAADVTSAVAMLTGALNDGGYLFLDQKSDLLVRRFIANVPGIERISGVVANKEGMEYIIGLVIYQKKAAE